MKPEPTATRTTEVSPWNGQDVLAFAQFESLWEAPIGVAFLDEDNPSWRAFTGQTPREWMGWGWMEAIHPEERAKARQVQSSPGAGATFTVELPLRPAGEGERP